MLIGLLGPVVIYGEEERTQLLEHRTRGVLAALAMHAGQKITQDQLAALLWDDIPIGASNNIRSYISQLRKLFQSTDPAADVLSSFRRGGNGGSGGYRLNIPRSSVDAYLFRTLVSRGQTALQAGDLDRAETDLSDALALWRGTAGGPDVAASQGLLEWLNAHNNLRVAAQEDLIETRLRRGQHSVLIPEIRELLMHNPFRERSWGQLAHACYFSGDVMGALDALNQARRILADNLGMEPGHELQLIQSYILNRAEHELRFLPLIDCAAARDARVRDR